MDGKRVELETRKALALLAYLSQEKRNFTRESLASLFWPEYDQSKALGNLRRVLWSINNRLQPDWLDAGMETVGLRRGVEVWQDVEAFRSGIAAAHSIADQEAALTAAGKALELYRGDFLEGFNLKDAPQFDDWQFFQREGLREVYGETLEWLAQGYNERENWEAAIGYARRWVALDSLHEPAQCLLMWTYAKSGNKRAAQRQYDITAQLLESELGQEPEPATTRLVQQITSGKLTETKARGTPKLAPAATAPEESKKTKYDNLPYLPTEFIGRADELGEIQNLLRDPACRLLTLLGPGGMGKTRLAIEAARQAKQFFEDGICFVPLAEVTTPDLLLQAVISQLQLPLTKQVNLDQQLINYLAGREMLLVFDNFEQLLSAAPHLTKLLGEALRVKLLVTSRVRLNLPGEWVFSLDGLSCPSLGNHFKLLEEYSAAHLFLQTARKAAVGFELAEDEETLLVRICQQVEGMPLGIEIAASWVRMLSLQEIVDELKSSLESLTSTGREKPDRQRSLHAVCEYSWNMLSDKEKAAFSKLSIFRGGFTRQAAQAVAGVNLAMLSILMDLSLIKRSLSGRYYLHEVLRQYGQEKLGLTPDAAEQQAKAHGTYFLKLLGERTRDILTSRTKEVIEEINGDLQNVRSAIEWAIRSKQYRLLNDAITTITRFYNIMFWSSEAVGILKRIAEQMETDQDIDYETDREMSLILGRMQQLHADFSIWLADKDTFLRQIESSAKIFRRWGSKVHEARLILTWATALERVIPNDDLPGVEKDLLRAYEILKADGDLWSACFCSILLYGVCYTQGKRERAKEYLERSLVLAEKINNLPLVAEIYGDMGELAHWTGSLDEACFYLEKSLTQVRELGFKISIHQLLDALGYVERQRGEFDSSERHHLEAMEISREYGDREGYSGSLYDLGLLMSDVGQLDRAVAYLQEALEIRRSLGIPIITSVSASALGNAYRLRGDTTSAVKLLEEGIGVAREMQVPYVIAYPALYLGLIALDTGDIHQAVSYFVESMQWALNINHYLIFSPMIYLAKIRAEAGEPTEGFVWLLFALRQPNVMIRDRQAAEELIRQLEESLSEERFDFARKRSEELTRDECVEEIKAWLELTWPEVKVA